MNIARAEMFLLYVFSMQLQILLLCFVFIILAHGQFFCLTFKTLNYMSQLVKIKLIEHITHDVLHVKAEKPENFNYIPGQAVDISIDKDNWRDVKSCFTFTSLPEDSDIEFTIKTYPSRKRVTNELLSAKAGDNIFVYKPFGDIKYKGEGIFLAGGAGVTPFIAIFKMLDKENKIGSNKLLFANKKKEDIILEDYFENLLGDNFVNVLSEEKLTGYENGYITADLIKSMMDDKTKYFYLCGPKPMMDAMEQQLASIGVSSDQIVKEGF